MLSVNVGSVVSSVGTLLFAYPVIRSAINTKIAVILCVFNSYYSFLYNGIAARFVKADSYTIASPFNSDTRATLSFILM